MYSRPVVAPLDPSVLAATCCRIVIDDNTFPGPMCPFPGPSVCTPGVINPSVCVYST